MKRFLPAALLLFLGSGAWGQSQPGVGLSINPVPGSGSNAGASTLRMDLGGSNPAAPAFSSLGPALSPSLSLSPKVSPAAPAVQAAAPAAGLSAAGTARAEDGLRAAPFVPTSRAAHAETGTRFSHAAGAALIPLQKGEVLSSSRRGAPSASMIGNSQETEALSPLQNPRAEQTPREESRRASAVLQAGRFPLEHPGPSMGNPAPANGRHASMQETRPRPPPGRTPPSGRLVETSPDPLADPEPGWKGPSPTGIQTRRPLASAALQTVGQVAPVSAGSVLSIFTQNAALLLSPWAWGVAGALALIGLPLRIFVFRLSPWSMHWLKDPGNGLAKKPLWVLLPLLAVAAASEELTFRAMAFGLSFVFLSTLMAAPLALAAASFLSSLVFALIHGYGPVWTRVVGGMLYSAAFAVTGSLLFITLAHMLFNLRALSLARRSTGR